MRLLTLIILLQVPPASAFEIIAHRGVHQEYHRKGLNNETCTATRIDPPTHEYLENTLPSIEKAFEHGATMVEIDVHPTMEHEEQPSEMVVFHDWTLDCRTNATCESGCKCNQESQCVTHEQPLAYLKRLDLGHGYTADGGKTYPFRGRYTGMMPTLQEALDLLEKHPEKKLLVNVKDKLHRTPETFLRIVRDYPSEVRSRIFFPRGLSPELDSELRDLGVPEALYQSGKQAEQCFKKYLLTGAIGYFPEVCRNAKFLIPIHETLERLSPALASVEFVDILWGWPLAFIRRAHRHGTKVYPAQVDSLEDYDRLRHLPSDGLMTNRIEVIGPHLLLKQ